MLAEMTGARLLRIEQAQPYPEDYHKLTEAAKTELRIGSRPELKTAIPDMAPVDTLFLGYPNWWGTIPMPVWIFLEALDTAGKTIAPFCTNEGSGMGRSEKNQRALCPGATILPGLPIIGHKVEEAGRSYAPGRRKSSCDAMQEKSGISRQPWKAGAKTSEIPGEQP